MICEGASEVGLVRGIDQHFVELECTSLFARGVALVDCTGGDSDRPFRRADVFRSLGYRVAVLRDDDKQPTPTVEQACKDAGDKVFVWQSGRALEDELVSSLTAEGVGKLLDYAILLHERELIDDHIKSASDGKVTHATVEFETAFEKLSQKTREMLGAIARKKKNSWFKSVTRMEHVGRSIVGPEFMKDTLAEGFCQVIADIFTWTDND